MFTGPTCAIHVFRERRGRHPPNTLCLWQDFSSINIYLHSHCRNIHLTRVFLFESHAYGPHSTPTRKCSHIDDPQTTNIAYFQVKNISKFVVCMIPIPHKIFKIFLKISVLKFNFEGRACDPRNT